MFTAVEGRYAQAFPSFGSERTGAPVMAFCRIDDRPIHVREPVTRRARPGPGQAHRPVVTVPATALALRHAGRPVPGAVLPGGLAALTGCVTIDSPAAAVQDRFPGPVGEANADAAREAYDHVRIAREERLPAEAD
ncbi:2-oxoacid:acceptor oxidoreductase family protein [Streptomyces hyaluromycini]|uniref:2-oxoacid:acceptor oxidoreductase family protein n=1 Tax=Streptomyces hyaluromycini TaxID=1377993 RepID=A0ABV1XDL2_9ACTN